MRISLLLLINSLFTSVSFAGSSVSNIRHNESAIFSLSRMVKKTMPSVVLISAIKDSEISVQIMHGTESEKSFGTGFFVSNNGYILTNFHVIKDSHKIEITTNDDRKYDAKLVGSDIALDIALLKIEAQDSDIFIEVTFDNQYEIGDSVFTIGNPFGIGFSVSSGIVSALGRSGKNIVGKSFIQTDAAINKGNSGGPLFNEQGYVIGMVNSVFSPTGVNVGTNFAIPSSSFFAEIERLKGGMIAHVTESAPLNNTQSEHKSAKPSLGIGVRNLDDATLSDLASIVQNPHGVFVTRVMEDGPADIANILPGDIIMDVDGIAIDSTEILQKVIEETSLGSDIDITIITGGRQENIIVKLL